jgi:PAS domain S-box-containing protein
MSFGEQTKNNRVQVLLSIHLLISVALITFGAIWLSSAVNWLAAGFVLLIGIFSVASWYRLSSGRASLSDHLAFLTQSIQSMTLNSDRNDAIHSVCGAALSISGAQAGALFLYQKQKNFLSLECQKGLPADQMHLWSTLPYLSLSEPTIVTNTATADDVIAELARQGGFRAYVLFPLQHGRYDVGVLALLYVQKYKPSPARLDLLRLLTTQLSAYLDNHELFGVLEDYAFEMTQLTHLSRITTSSMQLDRVLGDVTAMLCDMIDAKQVSIAILETDQRTLRVFNTAGQDILALELLPEIQVLVEAVPAFPVLLERGQRDLSAEMAKLIVHHGEQRLALFPMRANDRFLGVMLVGSERLRSFEDREWQFIELATNQIAAQLQNVLVHADTQQALHRRLEQLSLIEDIARQISGALDFNQIIEQMLEAALRATQGDSATLTLVETDELWTVIQRESQGETHRTYRSRRRQDSAVEQVVRMRKPLLVSDTRELTDYLPSTRTPCLSFVAVPLTHDNVVIGVLNVESVHPRFFTGDQVSFLSGLAGHAIISIRNARLLEEHQYQISTLRSLQALTLRLSGAITTQAVAGAIVETARDMLDAQDVVLFRYNATRGQLTLITTPGGKRTDTYIAASDALPAAQTGDIQVTEKITSKHIGTFVHMPIKYNGAVQEVLSLAFSEDRAVRPRDLNSVMVLASQAAGHLENAMLHEHIRAGADRMRAILNSTRDGILLIDRNGFLVECNPSAERLLGIDKDDFLGKHFVLSLSRVMGSDEIRGAGYSRSQLVALARQLRLEPERITSRQFSRSVGTQQIHIEEIGSPVLNNRSEIVGRLLVLRDVTEQKQLEVYRDEITHMAVHDLRGPLWAVISGINLALEDLNLLPQTDMIQRSLTVAGQSASGLLKLVDSLLDISRLETRQMPLQRAPVMLDELIAAALGSLSASVEEADIELETEIDEGLAPLTIDPVIIQRVVVNLIDNALRHTPSGGKILISAQRNGRNVLLLVADSGPGIPPGERERVFERFRQVKDNIPVRGSKGSGLGLTFCKLAVEAHDGHIWVEANGPLPGACFVVSLPIATVQTPTSVPQ